MTMHPDLAVSAPPPDQAVPWHYGDPLREQRALTESAAIVRRARDVLTVTGPDRLPWLHSICSQHLTALGDGDATEALVLSPHGHVEQHWQVAELAGTVWIDTEPGSAAQVLGYLRMMQFLKRVESRDVTGDYAVLTVAGPAAETVLQLAGLPVPAESGRAIPLGDGFVRRRGAEFDVLAAASELDALAVALESSGGRPAGLWAYEALRVTERRPRLGFETDHRTIPHEVGWIGRAVHLDKGCYRGQETVARVQNLGRPPRRLVLVHLAGNADELPEPGTAVTLAGRTVGFLGTAVHHHELGPIALAVVKRNLPDDAELEVGGAAARIDPA